VIGYARAELIDGLLSDYKNPEDILGENGILKQLTKAVVERALEAEMEHHLGHGRHEPVSNATGNTRNGRSRKTLKVSLVNCQLIFPVTATGILNLS